MNATEQSEAIAELEQLRVEFGQLRHQYDRAVKLADDRLEQMKTDRAQAIQWRDEIERLRATMADLQAHRDMLANAIRRLIACYEVSHSKKQRQECLEHARKALDFDA